MRSAVISLGLPAKPVDAVMIIDDHPLFREALAMTLITALKVPRVATAPRLTDALAILCGGDRPDAILVDLDVADTGIQAIARLRTAAPGTPIIAIAHEKETRAIAAVLEAGAAGFIPKFSPREVFVRALSEVWAGGIFTPEGYRPPRPAPRRPEPPAEPQAAALTWQQTRILDLVRQGKLDAVIARELGMAETTVKAHITAILRKLDAQTRGSGASVRVALPAAGDAGAE